MPQKRPNDFRRLLRGNTVWRRFHGQMLFTWIELCKLANRIHAQKINHSIVANMNPHKCDSFIDVLK
jgi:hypothetical protein